MNQARSDLERRAADLNGVQFEEVVRLSFSFEEVRAGFGRGAISAQIRPLLGEGEKPLAIYGLTVNNQDDANRLRYIFAG